MIESGQHLVQAAVYIDRNVADAGLVAEPADWPWHSFGANAALAQPLAFHSPSVVLDAVGEVEPDVSTLYAALVRSGLDRERVT